MLLANARQLHKFPLSRIERSDIADLLSALLERFQAAGIKGTVATNRTPFALSAFF
jgi:hypothetical protein